MKDLQALRQRMQAAWAIADAHHGELRDAYYYTVPTRHALMVGGPASVHSRGDLYDTTGCDAVEDFAGFAGEVIWPFDGYGFRYVAARTVVPEQRDVVDALADHMTMTVRRLLMEGEFPTALAEANVDLAFGTRFMRIERSTREKGKLTYTAIPAYRFAIDEDPLGRVDGRFWKTKLKARELDPHFEGARWSQATREAMQRNPDAEVVVEEALYYDPKRGLWRYCLLDPGKGEDETPALEQEHRTPPIVVTRWNHVLGQPWGYGPTLKMLPDIKTANKLVELTLLNLAIAVVGIWQAEDDGVLNPASIVLEPGTIIPKRRGSRGLEPLEAPGRFDLGQLTLDDIRRRIKAAHFADKLPERDRMTAYEIQQQLRQQQRELRGNFGRLKSEDVEETVRRVTDLARDMGLVPPELLEKHMDVEMQGPLAQALREQEADKIGAFRGELIGLFGQEYADVALKAELAVPAIARHRGIAKELVASEAELARHKKDLGAIAQMLPQLLEAMQAQGGGAGVAP